MLVGYVSDERYVAIDDVHLEFHRDGQTVAVVRSTPRGAVHADIDPGPYRVTLVKPGYGSKTVSMTADPAQPHQFRLLADQLLGYAWPKWVKSGERSEFRVHSPEAYRLSLWRYGWQKEQVRLIGWYDEHGPRAVMQITPDGDYTQTGVQWNKEGYGHPHHTQLIAGPERSGLYYFHAETDSGRFFAFPWVVAPASPQSDIAVLASTNTWNTYNNFGGRSNYIHSTSLPPEPTVNARQDLIRYRNGAYREWNAPDDDFQPLSFERPEPVNHIERDVKITDPIRGRSGCHLAPAEWRLFGWLEREGFGYDLYAEYHLHKGQLDLDRYRILIISTHPEYWSRAMFKQVKDWVFERGGRLMYLGGNGLNCEVEFLDDRTLRCKNHLSSAGAELSMRDPDNPERLFESRFHRAYEPEASLLGVVTTHTGIMTSAPYRVIDASHWIFDGTGLQNGDTFGAASLHERVPGGASGHETDKISPSSPPGTRLLAKGLNPEEGGSEIVVHATDSGGAVFSVGSITWPASILVDDHVARITANVIRRFLETNHGHL